MDLFQTLDDLKPFIFRIVDNGGETADRFTVITCDGDYFGMSGAPFHPQGFGQSGERIDVMRVAERVESSDERDLRWIDLPTDCQRCVMGGLNQGFEYYIDSESVAESREAARDWEGLWDSYIAGTPIYKEGDTFRIRDDERRPPYGDGDAGPFATFREAVLYMLPQDYDCSGPEYHTTVDLWDESGGPAPLWDRENDPPVVSEDVGRASIVLENDDATLDVIAWFPKLRDAENFLNVSAMIDPDKLHAGCYTIDDLDHPDAPTRRR